MLPITIGVLALIAVAVVVIYNGLVRLNVQAGNAWADIDVQLKRRSDLIPNVVETVKGYASHERPGGVGTFRPSVFTHNLGVMSTAAATTMSSAPRSSGGSGFSGGSSGGGFGGGGGGGF